MGRSRWWKCHRTDSTPINPEAMPTWNTRRQKKHRKPSSTWMEVGCHAFKTAAPLGAPEAHPPCALVIDVGPATQTTTQQSGEKEGVPKKVAAMIWNYFSLLPRMQIRQASTVKYGSNSTDIFQQLKLWHIANWKKCGAFKSNVTRIFSNQLLLFIILLAYASSHT